MESVKKKIYMDHMIQSTSNFVNVPWIQIWRFQIFPLFFLFPVGFPHGEKTEKGMPATSASKSAKNLHFISKLGNFSWNILHQDHYPLTHSKKKLKKWAVFHFWSQRRTQTNSVMCSTGSFRLWSFRYAFLLTWGTEGQKAPTLMPDTEQLCRLLLLQH